MSSGGLLYKKTTNRLLDNIAGSSSFPSVLPSEDALASQLEVSRSTVRKVIARLVELGIVDVSEATKTVKRKPTKKDRFDVEDDAVAKNEEAERFVLDKLAARALLPNERFSELELARESGCNRAAIREALLRVSRYGLIEKVPRQQWRVIALDEKLINELVDMRELFEIFAVKHALALPPKHTFWGQARRILREHKAYNLKNDPDGTRFHELDMRMHQALLACCANRFVDSFFDVCLFIMDYQLRPEELFPKRVLPAVLQHLAILNALLQRNEKAVLKAVRTHMDTVRQLLLETAKLYGWQ